MKFLTLTLSVLIFTTAHSYAQTTEFPDAIPIETIQKNKFDGVCYQDVRRFPKTGTPKNSTSFFISKNYLLTSAHNVTKLPFHSVRRMTIFPSRIGDVKHLDSIQLKIKYKRNIRYPKQYSYYKGKSHNAYDIALIYIPDEIIDTNEKLESIPYLPLVEDGMEIKEGEYVYCVGYPAQDTYSEKYLMTLDSSKVIKVHQRYFEHRLETLRGNSGSPILIKRNNKFYVVGVNSMRHHGTLIHADRKRIIELWKKELNESY
ncbi:trypsin-like peptidase domain-containing protein [uncultured Dokdonia sp.]|uniref:trypsin-like serine peptidase n=1 Tax=uncultured Dokdonia sp. TaxID=575653 RepID=UPI002607FCA7|nr:trypsin-like peptidase domain-containing protein [uncultured Dokdonia sp.]